MNSLKKAILTFLVLTIVTIVIVVSVNYFSAKDTPICQDLYKYINNGTGVKLYPNIEQKMIDTYTASNYTWFPYYVDFEKGKMLTEKISGNIITCEVPVRYCEFNMKELGRSDKTVRLCIDEIYIVLVKKTEHRLWKYGN